MNRFSCRAVFTRSSPPSTFSVTLRRIDLSSNLISEIDDAAFSKLLHLEELSLAENRLTKLPTLPTGLTLFNANLNRLRTQGVRATAFKVSSLDRLRGCQICIHT